MSKFSEWYSNPANKQALNLRRRERYREDKVAREKAQMYQAAYRARQKGAEPVIIGTSRDAAANALGISVWTLHSWGKKGYYPPPEKIVGRVQFTDNQMGLLGLLAEFHAGTGPRLSPVQRDRLGTIVEIVHQNWS